MTSCKETIGSDKDIKLVLLGNSNLNVNIEVSIVGGIKLIERREVSSAKLVIGQKMFSPFMLATEFCVNRCWWRIFVI